jgi:WD40 repeat protein
MRRFDGHDGPVFALAFLAGGQRLASAGKDGVVQFIDLSTDRRRQLGPLKAGASPTCHALAAHPSGTMLAVGTAGGVTLWDTQADAAHRVPRAIPGGVTSLAYLDRGRLLAIGFGDSMNATAPGAVVLMGESGSVRQTIDLVTSVTALAAEPVGKRIVWGAGDRRVCRWDVTSPDRRVTPAQSRYARAVALNPGGGRIAAADDYGIHAYDAESMRRLATLRGHTGRIDALAYASDGRLLSGAADRTVRVWDAGAACELAAHDWDVGGVRAVAVSPDGLLAAAAGDRGTIVIWDLDA